MPDSPHVGFLSSLRSFLEEVAGFNRAVGSEASPDKGRAAETPLLRLVDIPLAPRRLRLECGHVVSVLGRRPDDVCPLTQEAWHIRL